ncbi:hypothetical protein [Yoonia sp. R78084]|uniref:hypothetical protein n=1 Tax=Yoonia sp. R78084 TaxID=3093869 RepID=UPI0037DC5852
MERLIPCEAFQQASSLFECSAGDLVLTGVSGQMSYGIVGKRTEREANTILMLPDGQQPTFVSGIEPIVTIKIECSWSFHVGNVASVSPSAPEGLGNLWFQENELWIKTAYLDDGWRDETFFGLKSATAYDRISSTICFRDWKLVASFENSDAAVVVESC